MSDDEYESNVCPLCVEEIDLSDKNFLPCPCGYRVCMWCWHHIRENLNGLCPACRTPYNADPHLFSAVDRQEVVKKNRERKQKEKQEKKVDGGKSTKIMDRKHLHNFRVVQRNLVYVLGLPSTASLNGEILRKPEYFGQYGKITKIVVHTNPNLNQNTVSAYVTFAHKEDALAAIQVLDGFWIDGHPLRASFGTTKYCNNFIRHVPCQNPDCVYLHELGDEDDRFTKEEIQSGHSKASLVPGKDQLLITGQGGPSGSGKKPTGETILPPPVFIQDSIPITAKPGPISRSQSSTLPVSTFHLAEEKLVRSASSSLPITDMYGEGNDMSEPPQISETRKDSPLQMGFDKVSNEDATSKIDSKQNEEIALDPVGPPSDLSFTELVPNARAFNGVTWNAVFPVPASSLSVSIWATVGSGSDSNLSLNPFSKLAVTFSELLDLTLPPVDASLNAKPTSSLKMMSTSTVTSSTSLPNGVSGAGLNALRQMLPSVNMSFGGSTRPLGE